MQSLRLVDHSCKTSCSYACYVITYSLPVATAVITVTESLKNIIILPEITQEHKIIGILVCLASE